MDWQAIRVLNLNPFQKFLVRLIAWIMGSMVSVLIAPLIAILTVIGASGTSIARQEFFGLAVGLFVMVGIWPGLLTGCIILFDSLVTVGFSKSIFWSGLFWSFLPVAFLLLLSHFKPHWIRVTQNTYGNGIGDLATLAVLIGPSLFFALLAIMLRRTGGSAE